MDSQIMQTLPATDLRRNVLTLAVATEHLPAAAACMRALLPPEEYDPEFRGQVLETTYFDTRRFPLRKARARKKKYLTLRIRCYGANEQYALSTKTEEAKFRTPLPSKTAEAYVARGFPAEELVSLLPADVLARLIDLADGAPLVPIVTLTARRYAVENDVDRLTLDTNIVTNTGKVFPAGVLEHKTTAPAAAPAAEILQLALPPVKLSKFLWATSYGARS
jgi:hypothetical protein